MSEPGYCTKCRKDVLIGEHKCPPAWARLLGHVLTAAVAFAVSVGETITKGCGYAIAFYFLWIVIRLDVATVIGLGIHAGAGVCQ